MKIEKINENQIRCTLTKEDLEARHINLSELAYGSEKANDLFKEMVQQASREYGFEVNDIPLMVEAIPARTGNLVLVISKVEYPDELDARFSRFSEPGEEYLKDTDPVADILSKQGASDILDLFREMKESLAEQSADSTEAEITEQEAKEAPVQKEEEKSVKKDGGFSPKLKADADIVSVFEFEHMSTIERLGLVLKPVYHGRNDLYKLGKGGYFLLMHKNDHTPEEFNKICNIASEYGRQKPFIPAVGAYFEEHSELLRSGDALQTMAALA